MKNLKNKLNSVKTTLAIRMKRAKQDAADTLTDNSGQFVVDHAVVFIAIVVVGGLVLLAMKDFLTDQLIPAITAKIMELFN